MSQRLGTLLEVSGRPKQIVEIVWLGSKQARIRESYYMPGDTKYVETKVPRDRVIEDGGEAYRRQGKSKCATYLDLMGEPSAMVKVVRAYRRKSVVRFFEGEQRFPETGGWGREEDVETRNLLWDAGKSWGKRPSKLVEQEEKAAARASSEATPAFTEPSREAPQSSVTVSYMRVSSQGQRFDRQAEEIYREVGTPDKEFTDKVSAAGHADRPGLDACLDYLRAGDVLVVASIDRLARSMVDLRRIVDAVVDKSAQVRFVKESLVFGAGSDPRSDLMLGILGSLAEFERAIIRERQAEGIAAAKKRGVYKGRKPSLSRSQIDQARQLKSEGVAVTEIARRLGVHRSTIYRALAD